MSPKTSQIRSIVWALLWGLMLVFTSGCDPEQTPSDSVSDPTESPSTPRAQVPRGKGGTQVALTFYAEFVLINAGYKRDRHCIEHLNQSSQNRIHFYDGSCGEQPKVILDRVGDSELHYKGIRVGTYSANRHEIYELCSRAYEAICEPVISSTGYLADIKLK